MVPTLVQLNSFNSDSLGALKALSEGTILKKLGKFSLVNIGWVSAYDSYTVIKFVIISCTFCWKHTCVRCQCLEAFAIGSVTWVQAAPNSISLCGPLCIMSKNAFTPTAALHCKNQTINEFPIEVQFIKILIRRLISQTMLLIAV